MFVSVTNNKSHTQAILFQMRSIDIFPTHQIHTILIWPRPTKNGSKLYVYVKCMKHVAYIVQASKRLKTTLSRINTFWQNTYWVGINAFRCSLYSSTILSQSFVNINVVALSLNPNHMTIGGVFFVVVHFICRTKLYFSMWFYYTMAVVLYRTLT